MTIYMLLLDTYTFITFNTYLYNIYISVHGAIHSTVLHAIMRITTVV